MLVGLRIFRIQEADMSIEDFVIKFNAALDQSIHRAMEGPVTDSVKAAIVEAVQTEVYDAYERGDYLPYIRRDEVGKTGGLQDWNVMESKYDPSTMTLEVQDMSRGDDTGRLIAPVVESGKGYQWKKSTIYKTKQPRPFHKEAQSMVMREGIFSDALRYQLKRDGFDPKL